MWNSEQEVKIRDTQQNAVVLQYVYIYYSWKEKKEDLKAQLLVLKGSSFTNIWTYTLYIFKPVITV
jgi:hypothetical protein